MTHHGGEVNDTDTKISFALLQIESSQKNKMRKMIPSNALFK
jgi:hypothetical protein